MSRGPEILRLAQKLGIELRLEGQRIRWRAKNGLDPIIAKSIAANRADVVDELERLRDEQQAEEQAAIAAYAAREQLARDNARVRIANGTTYARDRHLAAGIPIATAERLAAHSNQEQLLIAEAERKDGGAA